MRSEGITIKTGGPTGTMKLISRLEKTRFPREYSSDPEADATIGNLSAKGERKKRREGKKGVPGEKMTIWPRTSFAMKPAANFVSKLLDLKKKNFHGGQRIVKNKKNLGLLKT